MYAVQYLPHNLPWSLQALRCDKPNRVYVLQSQQKVVNILKSLTFWEEKEDFICSEISQNWHSNHISTFLQLTGFQWTSGSGTTSLAWTYIKYVDTVTVFEKNWNKGHWPLDDLWPHIFWGLMCDSTQGSLCPSPMKYIKVCGYSDFFAKTWSKGHWPLDELWPHICWGHMCDSTQGSLCPSPMKIH